MYVPTESPCRPPGPALRAVINETPSPMCVVRQSEHMLCRTRPVWCAAARSTTPTSLPSDSVTR